jgi:hypothetical protein
MTYEEWLSEVEELERRLETETVERERAKIMNWLPMFTEESIYYGYQIRRRLERKTKDTL